jgi:PleD family two-component response regulator
LNSRFPVANGRSPKKSAKIGGFHGAYHRFTFTAVGEGIGMPYMDGTRFRDVQRTLPGMADIPVIVISGRRSRLLHLKALGAREVFFKPLDAPKLLQTIRAL